MRRLIFITLLLFVPTHGFCFCFQYAGQIYGVNPALVYALAAVESNLSPRAIHYNRDGTYDYGLMQINSRWYNQLKDRWNYLANPCYNVLVGTWILRQCIDRYGYNWNAISCYHTGKPLYELSPEKKRETLHYIRRIERVLKKLKTPPTVHPCNYRRN